MRLQGIAGSLTLSQVCGRIEPGNFAVLVLRRLCGGRGGMFDKPSFSREAYPWYFRPDADAVANLLHNSTSPQHWLLLAALQPSPRPQSTVARPRKTGSREPHLPSQFAIAAESALVLKPEFLIRIELTERARRADVSTIHMSRASEAAGDPLLRHSELKQRRGIVPCGVLTSVGSLLRETACISS